MFSIFRWHGRRVASICTVGLLALSFSVGLIACGSESASSEEIAQAERRGEKRGRRLRAEAEEKRQIKRELEELKKKTRPEPPANDPEGSGESSGPSGVKDCSNGLSAGPSTECDFAENVRYDYENEVGAGFGIVFSWSPSLERFFRMECSAGEPHECEGAIDATVYFP